MPSLRDEIVLRQKWLEDWPGHATLIEPTIGSTAGAPDASLVAKSFEPGWVEFKALDPDGLFKMEPSQRLWMRDFIRSSSRCAIVAMDNLGFFTIPIWEVLRLGYQPTYHAPSLPSIVGWVTWEELPRRDLPKLLELTYVASR
jgi:hypothetical protein